MAKNITKRKTAYKKSSHNESAGVLLVILSVFCLLCLIFPVVLSDIGIAVRNLLLGLLGYISYPIFLCTLIWGIAIIQNRSVNLSLKQIVYIFLIAFIVCIILQLITSTKYMISGVEEYISTVYKFSDNATAGGIVFGVFAYALMSFATTPGAYIALSLFLITLVLLLTADLSDNIQKRETAKNSNRKSNNVRSSNKIFKKGNSTPKPLTPVTDASLFVGEIVPVDRANSQINGSFDNLQGYEQGERISNFDEVGNYYTNNDYNNNYSNNYNNNYGGNYDNNYGNNYTETKETNWFDAYRNAMESSYDMTSQKTETDAHKILFGNNLDMFKTYNQNIASNMGVKGFSSYSTPSTSTYSSSAYEKQNEPKLEAVIPPSKEFLHQYIDGDIVNGDDFNDGQNKNNTNHSTSSNNQSSKASTYKQDDNQLPPEITEKYNTDTPLINGDFFINKETAQTKKETASDYFDKMEAERTSLSFGGTIINSNTPSKPSNQQKSYKPEDSVYAPYEHEYYNDNPIINDYNYKEVGEVLRKKVEKELQKDYDEDYFDDDEDDEQPIVNADDKQNSYKNSSRDSYDEIYTNENSFNKNNTSTQKQNNQSTKIDNEADEFEDYEDDGIINDSNFQDYVEKKQQLNQSHNIANDFEQVDDKDDFDGSYDTGDNIDDIEIADEDNNVISFDNLETDDNSVSESNIIIDDVKVEEIEISPSSQENNVTVSNIEKNTTSDSKKDVDTKQNSSDKSKKSNDVVDEPINNKVSSTKESYFNIVEEVEDKSENNGEITVDNTGYYNVNTQPINPNALKKEKEQVKMEDYMAEVAKSIPVQKTKRRSRRRYNAPPIDLLINTSTDPSEYGLDCETKAKDLEEKLRELKLPAKVQGITKGPAATRYELEMPSGISVKKIEGYSQDIAYALACNGKIRIESPIPGMRAVGVEVPNEKIAVVSLREVVESKEFKNASSPLTVALGKDITGKIILCPLDKMPHLLIGGQTGSGKSACLNSIIISLLYKSTPDDVRLILIDPKLVEFAVFKGVPHLLLKDTITTPNHALSALKWLREEMDKRYTLCAKYACRNISEFNACEAVRNGEEEKLHYIVTILDEFGDLMTQANYKKEIEENIQSIAQKARAAGIHLILATQRPSVNVITGTIKTNLNSRIAFAVSQAVDSRTILDQTGAEALLGRGDMLYFPSDVNEPKRVQGAYVGTDEVESVVRYIKENNVAEFDESIEEAIMTIKEDNVATNDEVEDSDSLDPLFKDVVRRVIESKQASATMIQTRFSIGYARAARIINQMEALKYIGPREGNSKPREIYISREQFKEFFGEDV